MALVVRPFEDRDRDGSWHVGDITYRDGRSTPVEDRVFKITKGYVAELDGKIVGIFSVLDLSCTVGDRANLRCAGVAGVAVLPEYRHLGVGSEMMRWSIPHFRDQGYHMASLYGFRESFYRKFGYEMCGLRLEITAPTYRLPRLKPVIPVRTISWEDDAQLQACHEAFARRYSGNNIREKKHWNRILNDRKTVYVAGDPIEAYAILEHKIDFWNEQTVHDIGWTTREGHESIIAVLSQICINKKALVWNEPSDSLFLQRWRDQGIDAKMDRPIMYRLLDVPKCMEALSPVGAGAFSLEVQDELIPENNGPWRVEDDGASVRCSRVDSGDLVGTTQEWVQAYLGDPGIERGPIRVKEAGAMAAAAKFLTPQRVYCPEFF
jgi:predicted acetyltransferase